MPKLSIFVVQPQGAEGHRIVHPTIFPCAQAYIMYRTTLKQGAITGCKLSKMCATGSQIVHAGMFFNYVSNIYIYTVYFVRRTRGYSDDEIIILKKKKSILSSVNQPCFPCTHSFTHWWNQRPYITETMHSYTLPM